MKTARILSLMLAAALQLMPMLRSVICVETQGLAPSSWAIVFRLATGAAALFGYHAVSSATSITLSPPLAFQGVPYNGIIKCASAHTVGSWLAVSNVWSTTNAGCNGIYQIAPGIFAVPVAGVYNQCMVTGVCNVVSNYPFRFKLQGVNGCVGSSASPGAKLIVGNTNPFAPTWVVPPAGQVAQVGADTFLSCGALARPAPVYNWLQGLLQIQSSTNNTYLIPNAQLANAGLYTVTATNSEGSSGSTNAYLTVIDSPSSLKSDYTNYLPVGASTNLTVTVSNVNTATTLYHWQYNGGNLPGGSGTNFLLSNVGNDYASGVYTISISSYVVTGSVTNFIVGSGLNSGVGYDSYWEFGNPPAITQDLTNITANAGDSVTFAVKATGATDLGPDLLFQSPGDVVDLYGRSMLGTNYQWYFNSSPLAGQTNASLIINPVSPGNAGNYFVTVTNVYGAVTSSVVSLTGPTLSPLSPAITQQPTNQTVTTGGTATFTVSATGSPPISYQWYYNTNTLLATMTNATLTLTNVQLTNAGTYAVVVSNSSGSIASSNALLTVNVPASITTQPADQTVIQGAAATFNVVAGGTAPFTYKWKKNGVNLADGGHVSGSATNTLTLNPATTNDAGIYSVAITNVAGQVTSSNAVLTVTVPPLITQQPVNQAQVVGNPATFSVTATGTAPLGYQWLKNSVPLADGGTVSGSATSNLNISAVAAGDAGAYSVVVTNVAGSVGSSNAVLTVNGEVYLVATNVVSGSTVSVPVRMTALGTEVSVGFSLTFDPVVLTYAGLDDPSVTVNTNSAGSGRLGMIFQNLGGYSAGDQGLVNVLFTASPVTTNTASGIAFGNSPVTRQVIDNSFSIITNVVYAGTTVTVVPAEYAGDVYPRFGGDSTVNLQDWAEMGRMAAGLDVVSNADEMLRADCAPPGNPDGVLTVADWVQAGRYAAGLDPLTIVNNGGDAKPAVKLGAVQPLDSPSRVVQLVSVAGTNGQSVTVPVNLVSLGNENALGFNVTYDAAQLVFKGAVKGSAAAASQLNVNSNLMASGQLGLTLALGAGKAFPAGTDQLVILSFGVLNSASGDVALSFAVSTPVVEQICDTTAASLSASYVSAVVSVPVRPTLQIQVTDGNVWLTWPQAYSNYTLQSIGLPGVDIWNTNAGSPSLNGTNLQVGLPATNPQQLFRLKQ